jgi:hypothetical protein
VTVCSTASQCGVGSRRPKAASNLLESDHEGGPELVGRLAHLPKQRREHARGRAGALLQAKGSGWLHSLVPRAAHDDGLLAALRSRIGDAAFEQAWTRGQSLRGSRAVEYALAEAE